MNFLVSIILFCAIAGSCLPSGFAVDVCNHEFEVFRIGIQRKCSSSLYPSPPPIEVDGELLARIMDANHGNVYTSILFYDARCPFSRVVRLKFDVLTSIFPHIKHLIAEQSQALPSVFSRYGILACLQF